MSCRWRITDLEKPELEGEYITLWRKPSGGWELRWDWYSDDDGFAGEDGNVGEMWMPCPEFPRELISACAIIRK